MQIEFIFTVVLLAIAPGPDVIFLLSKSIANGAKAGIQVGLGLSVGCIVHTLLVALGVGALIKNNDTLFTIIKITGAMYMLYLAYKVATSPSEITINQEGKKNSRSNLFVTGLLMNLLNPKVTLFFLALLPAFVKENETPVELQLAELGVTFAVVSFMVFTVVALLGAQAARFIKSSRYFETVMKYLQIAVFIGIALLLILTNK